MTAIVTWLSANTDLPPMYEHPAVRFIPQSEIASMHYAEFTPERWTYIAADGSREEIVSVYSTVSKTIFLQSDWSGVSPAEISVLVHEMTHHLQNAGGLRYECPAAREKLAYAAQALALAQYGKTLEGEFETDNLTLLARTTCAP